MQIMSTEKVKESMATQKSAVEAVDAIFKRVVEQPSLRIKNKEKNVVLLSSFSEEEMKVIRDAGVEDENEVDYLMFMHKLFIREMRCKKTFADIKNKSVLNELFFPEKGPDTKASHFIANAINNGRIAVMCNNLQKVANGESNDYKITISLNQSYFTITCNQIGAGEHWQLKDAVLTDFFGFDDECKLFIEDAIDGYLHDIASDTVFGQADGLGIYQLIG